MDEPTTTTIVFPKATYKLLKQQAKDTDRSVGSLVRLAVDSYLQRIQEQGTPYSDVAQPPAAAQKAKAGK